MRRRVGVEVGDFVRVDDGLPFYGVVRGLAADGRPLVVPVVPVLRFRPRPVREGDLDEVFKPVVRPGAADALALAWLEEKWQR